MTFEHLTEDELALALDLLVRIGHLERYTAADGSEQYRVTEVKDPSDEH
jgi:hypothetical protein